MTVKELACKRESCRAYDGRTVSYELLQDIMETACLAPSACNSQPWRMIGVYGEHTEALAQMIKKSGRNNFVDKAGAFVVICETQATLKPGVCTDEQYFAKMDLGMATMLLTLAATEKGLSTCILGCFDEEAVRSVLQIPASIPIRLIVAVGYAEQPGVREKIRKPAEETRCFQTW